MGVATKIAVFPALELDFSGFRHILFIPTRCRDLRIKQFCLEDIAPAILIILIAHIIIAVRWMLIKILSVVINGQRSHKVIVPGGCYLIINIIHKNNPKIKFPC